MINDNFVNQLQALVYELGLEVEIIKKRKFILSYKNDGSPLTEADALVNNELFHFLKTSKYQNIISEETKLCEHNERKSWKYYWVIDPIDGTKEFIRRGNDYTINVALCFKNYPIFGLVYAPATQSLYCAQKGKGSYKNQEQISVKSEVGEKLTIVASRSHTNKETENFIKILSSAIKVEVVSYGSSLKICAVAEGSADIYPRLGPTMEWDTAAAQLVLEEAGGKMLTLQTRKRLNYNKGNLMNPSFFCCSPTTERILSTIHEKL
ncbi:3'(2'),5'-bisphosphate nucleotidase CysQ [SAR86 cluster bacterium]|nr:3'(2'),5'-bisphosphate nucleotidase CysQ [SAR86 cluster bacterium]